MKKAFTSASKKKKKKKKEAAAFFVSSRGCFGSSSSSSSSFGGTLVIMRYSFIQVCSFNNTFFPQRREKSTVFGKEERVCAVYYTLNKRDTGFQTLNKKTTHGEEEDEERKKKKSRGCVLLGSFSTRNNATNTDTDKRR